MEPFCGLSPWTRRRTSRTWAPGFGLWASGFGKSSLIAFAVARSLLPGSPYPVACLTSNAMSLWKQWLQQPQRVWLRRALFQIHLWTGLALGLYIVVLSVTGSALVYRRELVALFSTPYPALDSSARKLSADELRASARRAYPDYEIADVKEETTRRRTVVVHVTVKRDA